MNFKRAVDNHNFDIRMVNLNLRTGVVKKEDVKKFLDSLPDLSDKAEKLKVEHSGESENPNTN